MKKKYSNQPPTKIDLDSHVLLIFFKKTINFRDQFN